MPVYHYRLKKSCYNGKLNLKKFILCSNIKKQIFLFVAAKSFKKKGKLF